MKSIAIYCVYAEEDKELRDVLYKHMASLVRSELVNAWLDREISFGTAWDKEDTVEIPADIVLVLISADFIASDYLNSVEMKRFFERLSAGETTIIPILLRPTTTWRETILGQLPTLPTNTIPVTQWPNLDTAFVDIVRGIRAAMLATDTASPNQGRQTASRPDQQIGDEVSSDATATKGSEELRRIARFLEVGKNNNRPAVLLLGSRAGGLFRSEHFYNSLEPFSNRAFSMLSRPEKFRKSYYMLTDDGQFSATETRVILRTSLQHLAVTAADTSLAELTKLEYFDEIVSTNIDDMLEDALVQVGMKEQRDFEVCSLRNENLPFEKKQPIRLIKAYGDLTSRNYSIVGRLTHFDRYQELASFLQRVLTRDILVVGIDPVWDAGILRMLLSKGGTMWFVNEENLAEHPLMLRIQQERSVSFVSGREGSYESFMKTLNSYLYSGMPTHYQFSREVFGQLQALQDQVQTLQEGNQLLLSELKKLQKEISHLLQEQHERKLG